MCFGVNTLYKKIMKLNEIYIRDPFILPHEDTYYLYGKKKEDSLEFCVYESKDLENWSDPITVFEPSEDFWATRDFWAPEVHYYQGRFYMFASFKSEERCRGTQILVADCPTGPFLPMTKYSVTPEDWECLDGTLFVENNIPYIVFCHEWTQIRNGTVCAQELSKDLKQPRGEPFELWAGNASWADDIRGNGSYVTDGPFLVRKTSGELICIWSSFSNGEYVEAISRSNNGSIRGKWSIDDKLLFEKDGGHGMIFTDLNGDEKFIYHTPNETPNERPAFLSIDIDSL